MFTPRPACEVDEVVNGAASAAASTGADGDALVHERGDRDRPTFVDAAEHVIGGDAHVVEEHFVERRTAVHLLERLDR